ncbi:MAG TPA: tyrosine--tRNA ligase [Candidatus Saccharimonadales bacterium]|nr:tyrosine--tRNA ligase [Candidatus Saccharimonadales bacterium]
MGLSDDLAWRGLIKDKTFDRNSWLDKPQKFYLGIDASSDSLTIGNLAVIMLARRLIDAGWQAVLLAGGATSLVGDPGGKEEERELKSREEIAANIDGIKSQFERLFAGQAHELVNNLDWLDDLKYLNFLRDVGKYFSMTELIQREFVDARMGEGGAGISYAEFSYSLLQGYDFWWLFQNKDVRLQIGASDQWGNMLSGVALIRKKQNSEAHALSMPLVIDKTTGRKFGKSEAGAVWLDPAKTSPTQFYQFWINVDDASVEEFLKVYTLLSKERIEELMKQQSAAPQERAAQTALAREVTTLVHGEQDMVFAESVTEYLTGKTPIAEADPAALEEVRRALPNLTVQPGTPVIEVLVRSGLASSNSDARRLIQNRAVYINNEQFSRDHLEAGDFKNGRLMLRRGKAYKDSALIELA